MKIVDMSVERLLTEIKNMRPNPGGGAVVILVANMAVNLINMMGINMMGDVSCETYISQRLTELIQEDVDATKKLIAEIKKENFEEKYFIEAARPQIEMVDISLKALEQFSPILLRGRNLSDGIIANNLLKEAIICAMPTIEVNLKYTEETYDYESILEKCENLYQKNVEIIKGRK